MNKRTKNILAAFLLLLLCLPMLQDMLHLFPEKPLTGRNSASSVKPVFTFRNWFSGTWQDSSVIYHNQHFGLRTWYIRLNNQIYYSAFNCARANAVIVGENNYLHDYNYIQAYTGQDCRGYNTNLEWLQKFHFVQQALARRGITLLFVMVPGKTSYYPETLPPEYAAVKRRTTNNELLAHIADSLGVQCVNLSPYLLGMKKISPYPLYPPYGIHWSEYGMLLGMDSVGKFLERQRHIDLPDVKLNGLHWTDTLRGDDRDIGEGANLLFDLPKVKMAYPDYAMAGEGKTQLDVLCVGDSYYWQFFSVSKMERAWFRNSKYWFYFRELHTRDDVKAETDRAKINLRKELLDKQVIMVLNTDANLTKPGDGFIEEVYDMMHYTGHYARTRALRRMAIERDIRNDKNWLEIVRRKAEEKKIPLDSMIKLDAKYALDHEWQ